MAYGDSWTDFHLAPGGWVRGRVVLRLGGRREAA